MLAERSSLWGKVEMLRRYFEEIGMPKHKTNRFGRVEDFGALEPKDVGSFNARCRTIVRCQSGFSPPIREIMVLARQHGARVILLEMPMPRRHRELFYSQPAWAELRQHIQMSAQAEQAVCLSASDWMPDDKDFEDATHLNEQGARKFSAKLAIALASLENR